MDRSLDGVETTGIVHVIVYIKAIDLLASIYHSSHIPFG